MTEKKMKKKGIVRTEAVVPFFTIVIVLGLFFTFLFDPLVKWTMETAGYHILGTEVNIASFDTSFTNASVKIQGIEITDSLKPKLNSISIGSVRFSALWDALLRGKFVVNEVAVEQVEFGKPRKSPGKVKPSEPIEVDDEEPPPEGTKTEEKSKFSELKDELKNKAVKQVESQYQDNILSNAAAMLGGSSAGAEKQKIEGSVLSKDLAAKINVNMKARNEHWQARLKTLPTGKDFQNLSDRFNKIKFKDFKNGDELQTSLREFDAVLKEADAKYKELNSAQSDLNKDLSLSQQEIRDLEKQIHADIASLEKRFKIPKLDAKSLSRALFKQYLDPYLAKFNHFKKQAEKYVPPNIMKKFDGGAEPEEPDVSMQPRPREKGVVYEFGRPNSYPAFWIKRVSITSEAGRSPYAGDVKGEIKDITSNQVLVGRPTIATFAGDFPAAGLRGIDSKLIVDNRKQLSQILVDFSLGAFPLDGRDLIRSDDLAISFTKAQGQMKLRGELVGLKDFKMALNNNFTQVAYNIEAKSKDADELLKKIFAGIPVVTLNADGHGILPGISLSVVSNLGAELQRGIENQIKAKVAEARAQLEKHVQDQVGAQKAQLEAQFNEIKNGVEKEVSKLTGQAEAQKKSIEAREQQAKHDAENQGKKKLEDELKKRLGL